MNLKEFYNKLEAHDWFYMFSEDPGVYRRGQEAYTELNDIAMENSQEFRELLVKYKRYKQDPKNNPKPEKPTC